MSYLLLTNDFVKRRKIVRCSCVDDRAKLLTGRLYGKVLEGNPESIDEIHKKITS